MKDILLIFVFIATSLFSYSQSKKKQIERLNYRVDSLNQIIINQSEKNLIAENKISDLNNTIIKLQAIISTFNSDISKLKTEIGTNKKEIVAKNQHIANLEALIKSKSDSLTLFLNQQGYSLKTVTIGDKVWMIKNLNVSTFRNGDIIKEAKTSLEWRKALAAGEPAWCYYNNDAFNGEKYGKLYNIHAYFDSREIAPTGFRIPSQLDWMDLEGNFDTELINKVKSSSGWKHNKNGTNESGFSGQPGGYRSANGVFYGIGESAYWWGHAEIGTNPCATFGIEDFNDEFSIGEDKAGGYSIRCLKE